MSITATLAAIITRVFDMHDANSAQFNFATVHAVIASAVIAISYVLALSFTSCANFLSHQNYSDNFKNVLKP